MGFAALYAMRNFTWLRSVQTLDVSIIKATNHNKVPPKEKHIKGMDYEFWPQACSRAFQESL